MTAEELEENIVPLSVTYVTLGKLEVETSLSSMVSVITGVNTSVVSVTYVTPGELEVVTSLSSVVSAMVGVDGSVAS